MQMFEHICKDSLPENVRTYEKAEWGDQRNSPVPVTQFDTY